MLLKTKTYVKSYDGQTKQIILKENRKYNTIWDKFSSDNKEELDSKPVYLFENQNKIIR